MRDDDPFRHHPGLRGLITDPEASFFRSFRTADVDRLRAEQGLSADWRHPDAVIDAGREAFLADHAGDLWVFAYGSLMWDPAVHFAEVRRARVTGLARAFILVDDGGGRGTPQAPGLMAALDDGPHCDGLVFRLAEATLAEEFPRVWTREMIAPAYLPRMVAAETDHGVVQALAFVADPAAPGIRRDLDRAAQVRMVATGHGILGSTRAYLESLAAHFDALGIEDAEVADLLAAARGR